MDAKAGLLGHPIHQMLIVFPLGLLTTVVVFDIIYLVTDEGRWADYAWHLIAAGVIGGLLAAVFGLIDWLAVPSGTRAKRLGQWHGIGNVVVVALFGASWLLRRDEPVDPGALVLALSFLGAALSTVTGWLGGELVDRLGVGVTPGAHLNARSSLSDQPVRAGATDTDRRVPAA